MVEKTAGPLLNRIIGGMNHAVSAVPLPTQGPMEQIRGMISGGKGVANAISPGSTDRAKDALGALVAKLKGTPSEAAPSRKLLEDGSLVRWRGQTFNPEKTLQNSSYEHGGVATRFADLPQSQQDIIRARTANHHTKFVESDFHKRYGGPTKTAGLGVRMEGALGALADQLGGGSVDNPILERILHGAVSAAQAVPSPQTLLSPWRQVGDSLKGGLGVIGAISPRAGSAIDAGAGEANEVIYRLLAEAKRNMGNRG